MLTDHIIRYLESNKRLVVPQLGAFVVKAPDGRILFTELFRRDDGVLRGLLCAGGMSELEAAGTVDRFVFEVRHAVQEGREYAMEGFGVLRGGPDGTIVFEYRPAPKAEPSATAACEAPKVTDARAASGGPDAGTRPVPFGSAPAGPEAERAEAAAPAGAAPEAPAPKLRPDPSVKGLRYGKPIKTTDAYTYVGAAPRRKVDKLILVAIAAAVVALAAIAYGYIRDLQTERGRDTFIEEISLPASSGALSAPAEPQTQNE